MDRNESCMYQNILITNNERITKVDLLMRAAISLRDWNAASSVSSLRKQKDYPDVLSLQNETDTSWSSSRQRTRDSIYYTRLDKNKWQSTVRSYLNLKKVPSVHVISGMVSEIGTFGNNWIISYYFRIYYSCKIK